MDNLFGIKHAELQQMKSLLKRKLRKHTIFENERSWLGESNRCFDSNQRRLQQTKWTVVNAKLQLWDETPQNVYWLWYWDVVSIESRCSKGAPFISLRAEIGASCDVLYVTVTRDRGHTLLISSTSFWRIHKTWFFSLRPQKIVHEMEIGTVRCPSVVLASWDEHALRALLQHLNGFVRNKGSCELLLILLSIDTLSRRSVRNFQKKN